MSAALPMPEEILLAEPRGFCAGVVRAIDIVERALEKLSVEEAALHAEMAVHDQSDYDGLANLVNRQRDLNEKRESLEIEWLETSELVG